jgi:hypothetical protein
VPDSQTEFAADHPVLKSGQLHAAPVRIDDTHVVGHVHTFVSDGPVPKQGQQANEPDVAHDVKSMPGTAAGLIGGATGITDALRAARGEMTPEEQFDFAIGSIPMLLGGPEAGAAKEVAAGTKALLNAESRLTVPEAVAQARLLGHGASDATGASGAYIRAGDSGLRGVGLGHAATRYFVDPATAELWARAGVTAPDLFELAPQDAPRFKEALEAAKAASPHGAAVTVHPDYSDMRVFMTEDGKAGFALQGNDIVSVFKHPESTDKRVTIPMLDLAVQQGGRRLDAFDTQLPYLYGESGFKAVARASLGQEPCQRCPLFRLGQ